MTARHVTPKKSDNNTVSPKNPSPNTWKQHWSSPINKRLWTGAEPASRSALCGLNRLNDNLRRDSPQTAWASEELHPLPVIHGDELGSALRLQRLQRAQEHPLFQTVELCADRWCNEQIKGQLLSQSHNTITDGIVPSPSVSSPLDNSYSVNTEFTIPFLET